MPHLKLMIHFDIHEKLLIDRKLAAKYRGGGPRQRHVPMKIVIVRQDSRDAYI